MKVRHAALLVGFCATSLLFIAFADSQTSSASLQVSPQNIDFGEAAVDSNTAPRNITVSNPSNSPIGLTQILTSGIDFSQKNDCGRILAPGAQCGVQISFTPAISGPRTGNLQVMGSDGAPHFVALNGTGK